MAFSIIIPSRNFDNLKACVGAIRAAGETARVIVIDDHLDIGRLAGLVGEQIAAGTPLTVMSGVQPFCFARNANIGIRAAGTDDVILCNDDILLESPGGFTYLVARAMRGDGICSAAVKGPAHPAHAFHDGTWGTMWVPRDFVPFACVFLSRHLINILGSLDEQFTPGSWEDQDYCWRARKAGFTIGTDYGVVVDHQTLSHTFRPEGKPDTYDFVVNRNRFKAKWGKDRL